MGICFSQTFSANKKTKSKSAKHRKYLLALIALFKEEDYYTNQFKLFHA